MLNIEEPLGVVEPIESMLIVEVAVVEVASINEVRILSSNTALPATDRLRYGVVVPMPTRPFVSITNCVVVAYASDVLPKYRLPPSDEMNLCFRSVPAPVSVSTSWGLKVTEAVELASWKREKGDVEPIPTLFAELRNKANESVVDVAHLELAPPHAVEPTSPEVRLRHPSESLSMRRMVVDAIPETEKVVVVALVEVAFRAMKFVIVELALFAMKPPVKYESPVVVAFPIIKFEIVEEAALTMSAPETERAVVEA